MLGSGETEAAGLTASSLFPRMAIIHYPDFSRYFLHPPLFFSCLCFYFEQLGWRQRMRVRGGGVPTRVGSRSPSSKRWAPWRRRLTSPGALGSPETERAAPLPAPPAPEQKGEPGMGWGRWGIRSRAQGVLGATDWVGAVCLTLRGLARHLLEHAGPSLPSGGASLLLGPPTLHDQSHPRLASRGSCSSPTVLCRLFLSGTCTKLLWGREGDWGGESKSTVFELRSQKRSTAGWEQPPGAAQGSRRSTAHPTRSSSSRRSAGNPGTAGSAAPPAARPPGEPVPCAPAPCFQGVRGSSPRARRSLRI